MSYGPGNHRPYWKGASKPKPPNMSQADWDKYSRETYDNTGQVPTYSGSDKGKGGSAKPITAKRSELRTRTSNRTVGMQVQGDGRQIADLERAVHKLKNTSSAKSKNIAKGVGSLINIMGQEEERESQWMACVTDCEEFAARVPVGQTTGLVPVDLYRRTAYANGADMIYCNATNIGFALSTTDGWHEMAGVNNGVLHADGANASCGTTTQAAYVGGNTPSYAALPVGAKTILTPDVSSDFVSSAQDGTQYMQVAQKVSLAMFEPPNGAADSHFIGRAHVFQSIDPERSTLYNRTLPSLKEEAQEEGSNLFHQEFSILPNGRFVPIGLDATETENHEGFIEISAVSLPLNNLAYEWKRIGVNPLGSITDVVPNANILFVVESAQGTMATIRTTYVWQVERYPSNKLSAGGHMPIAAISKNPISMKSQLLGPKKPMRPKGPITTTDPRANDKVPPSAFRHSKTMLRNLGRPKHGIQAVVSVVCDRMTLPGVHAQVAASNDKNYGLGNLLAAPVASLVAKVGDKADDYIHEKIRAKEGSESSGGFWSSTWDFIKGIAPQLLALIPALL